MTRRLRSTRAHLTQCPTTTTTHPSPSTQGQRKPGRQGAFPDKSDTPSLRVSLAAAPKTLQVQGVLRREGRWHSPFWDLARNSPERSQVTQLMSHRNQGHEALWSLTARSNSTQQPRLSEGTDQFAVKSRLQETSKFNMLVSTLGSTDKHPEYLLPHISPGVQEQNSMEICARVCDAHMYICIYNQVQQQVSSSVPLYSIFGGKFFHWA